VLYSVLVCCWCAGIFLFYVCKETKTSITAVLTERYGFILSEEVFKQYVAKFSLDCFIVSYVSLCKVKCDILSVWQ
jgi:hypothetical protein